MYPPQRIVYLTEETVETLYLLGEQNRIVGVSGYVVRPPEARQEKPRVSAFISADVPKICALDPDLVLTFSDLQADIVAELVRNGIHVHAFNHRDVLGIFDMIRMLGALVGVPDRAEDLARNLQSGLDKVRERGKTLARSPRVFFEEWDDPLISCISWVSELVGIAGGRDVFQDRATGKSGTDRIVTAEEVCARQPDIIIGSWCGRKFQPAKVKARTGFNQLPAVRGGYLFEVKSPIILQPGPAALTDGVEALQQIMLRWAAAQA